MPWKGCVKKSGRRHGAGSPWTSDGIPIVKRSTTLRVPAYRPTVRLRSEVVLQRIVCVAASCFLLAAQTAMAQGRDVPTVCGKPAAYWAAQLKADDRETRSDAAFALALLVPDAKDALPALIAALDDRRKDLQYEVVQQLVEIGPTAAPAAPALAWKLRDNGFVRCGFLGCSHLAGDALAAIGPAAVPSLIDALGSTSQDARLWAADTLGRIGPAATAAVPQLDRFVQKYGAVESTSAVEALGKIGPAAAPAIPTLHAAYDALKPDDDPSTLLVALSLVGAPPSPGLIRRLDDAEPGRRIEAAYLLSEFGPKARSAVPRLEAALKDPSAQVRVQAAAALARIEPVSGGVLPTLIKALDSTDVEVLSAAIDGLDTYGPRASAAAPRIKAIVERNDLTHERFVGFQLQGAIAQAKASAAKALVGIAPDSRDGIRALTELLEQGSDLAVEAAIESLADLGPKGASAAPALARVAVNPKSAHRSRAIKSLMRIDPSNDAILPALIGILSDVRPGGANGRRGLSFGLEEEQADAITILGLMGPAARPAVPALVRLLSDGGPDEVPVKAAQALGRIGPTAHDAVPALVRDLKAEHELRQAAATALESMGTAASPATTDLIALLKLEPSRAFAARILGAIGPKARAAVPALIEAANDGNPFVVAEVGSALLRVDPTKRDVVQSRLASVRASNKVHASAILSGALGLRTKEADGFTRRLLRDLDRELMQKAKDVADPQANARELDAIEERFRSLADLGAGAADAVPRLAQLTNHADPSVRRFAKDTLVRIGTK